MLFLDVRLIFYDFYKINLFSEKNLWPRVNLYDVSMTQCWLLRWLDADAVMTLLPRGCLWGTDEDGTWRVLIHPYLVNRSDLLRQICRLNQRTLNMKAVGKWDLPSVNIAPDLVGRLRSNRGFTRWDLNPCVAEFSGYGGWKVVRFVGMEIFRRDLQLSRRMKIGRASCRERVYVLV